MISTNFKLSPVLQERYPRLEASQDASFSIVTRPEYLEMTPFDRKGQIIVIVDKYLTDVYCETDISDKELKQYVITTERTLRGSSNSSFGDSN